MALADIRDMGRHTTETCINLRPSPTNRGSYVLYLFDSHFTVQLSTWQMPVTLIRVDTSQQTARCAGRHNGLEPFWCSLLSGNFSRNQYEETRRES